MSLVFQTKKTFKPVRTHCFHNVLNCTKQFIQWSLFTSPSETFQPAPLLPTSQFFFSSSESLSLLGIYQENSSPSHFLLKWGREPEDSTKYLFQNMWQNLSNTQMSFLTRKLKLLVQNMQSRISNMMPRVWKAWLCLSKAWLHVCNITQTILFPLATVRISS